MTSVAPRSHEWVLVVATRWSLEVELVRVGMFGAELIN